MNRQAEFVEEFNSLPDWTERYQYICDLAAQMPKLPEQLAVPKNRVQSCQSTLYFHVSLNPVVQVNAWGNGAVSFGLAALIAKLFNGLTPQQLRQTGITFHTDTGLMDNLSPVRRQSLLEMLRRLK